MADMRPISLCPAGTVSHVQRDLRPGLPYSPGGMTPCHDSAARRRTLRSPETARGDTSAAYLPRPATTNSRQRGPSQHGNTIVCRLYSFGHRRGPHPSSCPATPGRLAATSIPAQIVSCEGSRTRSSVGSFPRWRPSCCRRPALSVAMRQFKDAGLVRYSRGQISIADRDRLHQRSCGCIGVIASEARRLENLEAAISASR